MRDDAATGVLRGIRIVDLSQRLAGSVCAMLLAEAGAEVVRIEPPGGDPLRGTHAFAAWNRSKAAVALDWRGVGRLKMDLLLAGADVLIHDLAPAEAAALGLEAASLARTAPALNLCTIGGYPAGHSAEDIPHDDFLVLAKAGILDEQQPVRRDGPTYLALPLGSWGAAWIAAIGVAARLLAQRRGGAAGPISTSLLQGALAHTMTHWRIVERPTPAVAGWPKAARNPIVECADGVWLHLMGPPDHVPLMREALDRMGPEEVARRNAALGVENRLIPNLGAAIDVFREHPSRVWLEALWAADIAVQPALRLGEVYQDEQARLMGYVVQVDDPELGSLLQPGPHVRVSPPMRIKGPAPKPNDALPDWSARAASAPATLAGRPLAGLRVLDFGQHLAGPFSAMVMADLGADVIKVESSTGDAMRPYEWAFIGCQRGKRALACNLKDPTAQQAIRALARNADVVVHNLRLPAAERLGLGYDVLGEGNPRLVYTHCSAYGSKGPRRDWPGYDQLFQALSGWEDTTGGEGNAPAWLRFGMMDHQCAFAATFGTLLALIERETTGQGQFVSTSILGAAILTTAGSVMVRGDGSVSGAPQVDALQLGVCPGRRLYACADGWVAVVADDAALARLGETCEAQFASHPVLEVVKAVELAGGIAVPAATEAGPAFLADPENVALGLSTRYPHPTYGVLTQPGAFLSMSGEPMVSDRAPTTLGQHSRAILAEAGLAPATAEQMLGEGLVVQVA